MIHWGHAGWLWHLLWIIPAAGLFHLAWCARVMALARLLLVPCAENGPRLDGGRFALKAALILGGVAMLVLALADPRFGTRATVMKPEGVTALFLLDVSKSMLTDDAKPSRLDAAKRGIRDIFKKLDPGDRAGIVAFSGDAVLYCPPTGDLGAFELFLDNADVTLMSRGGTNLGAAIDTAVASIEEARASHSVLVVFSDGGDHSGSAVAAAGRAKAKGVAVHCVGVGGAVKVPIRLRDTKGEVQYVRDAAGAMVSTRLEETLLREAAQAGGGQYFVMDPHGAWRDAVVDTAVHGATAGAQDEHSADLQIRRFQIPLLLAFILLFLEHLVPIRRASHAA